jgi:hypothetical protein
MVETVKNDWRSPKLIGKVHHEQRIYCNVSETRNSRVRRKEAGLLNDESPCQCMENRWLAHKTIRQSSLCSCHDGYGSPLLMKRTGR